MSLSHLPPDVLALWLTPSLGRLFDAYEQAGEALRFIGGCVRDACMERLPVEDLDLATTALPEETSRLIGQAGFRALPTGIEHGTVTALLPDHTPIQITTLRRDIACDGRHAEVRFGRDWEDDAQRRDFTFNALSADRHGRIFDPVGGMADLTARRLRFIGNPADRIAEDALRLLRYARFEAQLAIPVPPSAGLQSLFRQEAFRLAALSGERIAQEMLKLLAFPSAPAALEWMRRCGWLPCLALPEEAPLPVLAELWRPALPAPDPLLALACLLTGQPVDPAADRWRLSRQQRQMLETWSAWYSQLPASSDASLWQTPLYRIGRNATLAALRLAAAHRPDRYPLEDLYDRLLTQPIPPFPLTAAMVMQHRRLSPGPEVGTLLRKLENDWLAQGCGPSAEALLASLD